MAGTYAQQAAYLQEVAELKKMFPDIDFDEEWILVDVQGWSDYETGATYWLIEHAPTDKLYQIEDVPCLGLPDTEPKWADRFETTLEEWYHLITEVEDLNSRFHSN